MDDRPNVRIVLHEQMSFPTARWNLGLARGPMGKPPSRRRTANVLWLRLENGEAALQALQAWVQEG